MSTYRKRLTVEAEQFWPDKKPWPEGVLVDALRTKIEGYAYWLDTGYDANSSRVVPLCPGDWVITNGETYCVDFREACTTAMFPDRYEASPPPPPAGRTDELED